MFGFHPRQIERLTVGELLAYSKAAQQLTESRGGSRGR
jgi:hypothetical protein